MKFNIERIAPSALLSSPLLVGMYMFGIKAERMSEPLRPFFVAYVLSTIVLGLVAILKGARVTRSTKDIVLLGVLIGVVNGLYFGEVYLAGQEKVLTGFILTVMNAFIPLWIGFYYSKSGKDLQSLYRFLWFACGIMLVAQIYGVVPSFGRGAVGGWVGMLPGFTRIGGIFYNSKDLSVLAVLAMIYAWKEAKGGWQRHIVMTLSTIFFCYGYSRAALVVGMVFSAQEIMGQIELRKIRKGIALFCLMTVAIGLIIFVAKERQVWEMGEGILSSANLLDLTSCSGSENICDPTHIDASRWTRFRYMMAKGIDSVKIVGRAEEIYPSFNIVLDAVQRYGWIVGITRVVILAYPLKWISRGSTERKIYIALLLSTLFVGGIDSAQINLIAFTLYVLAGYSFYSSKNSKGRSTKHDPLAIQ